jgi:glycerate 2-kinase
MATGSALARLRDDAYAIGRAAMAATRADALLAPKIARWRTASARDGSAPGAVVIAAGKAAGAMLGACMEADVIVSRGLIATTHLDRELPPEIEVHLAGHPVPTEASRVAAMRALDLAEETGAATTLLVLLSGGASALLAAPAAGLSLEDKIETTRALLGAGAAIHELNCIRKHLSAIKGGRLGAATRARSLTWALSDVVGPVEDDPSVIGSGPTVADPTTFVDAVAIVARLGLRDRLVPAVERALEQGLRGERSETPKPGDPRLAHARFEVVGGRRDAMSGARLEAERRGYTVAIVDEPIVGEARLAGPALLEHARALTQECVSPCCVVASGETTVRVVGKGRGGRNQELALSAAPAIEQWPREAVLLSIGTDGIDGPTDAAGALIDRTTCLRARRDGVGDASVYLANNDAYRFLDQVGDLIRTGRTDTNVGDVQILLVERP